MPTTPRPLGRRSMRSTLGGLAAILSAAVALALTPFMATIWICDGTCYSYTGRPWVVQTFGRWLSEAGWFSGASATELYFAYGRWFVLVYVLLALGLWAFESARRAGGITAGGNLRRWAYRFLFASTLVAGAGDGLSYGIGVFSDWAWSFGFGVELLGMLGMTLGSIAYGIVVATAAAPNRWTGWLLAAAGIVMPVTLLDRWLVAYMPNAQLLPYTLAWAVLGLHLIVRARATDLRPVASGGTVEPA